jgi:hypothetical protein
MLVAIDFYFSYSFEDNVSTHVEKTDHPLYRFLMDVQKYIFAFCCFLAKEN